MWYAYFVKFDTSISSENQFIGINLGGQELQVDPKKMRLFHSQSWFCAMGLHYKWWQNFVTFIFSYKSHMGL